jgi:inhibitor of cysteine peptidase
MNNSFQKSALSVVLLIGLAIVIAFTSFALTLRTPISKKPTTITQPTEKLEKFKSAVEFKDFISKSSSNNQYGGSPTLMRANFALEDTAMTKSSLAAPVAAGLGAGQSTPRYSDTNVQVAGIDEPDIVKTDGSNLFYSRSWYYRPMPMLLQSQKMLPNYIPTQPENSIQILSAFPPANLAPIASASTSGNLLLSGNYMVVFTDNQKIVSYDISNPKSPVEKWTANLQSNQNLVAARLYQGKIYTVLSSYVDSKQPCPIYYLDVGSTKNSIPCTDIYHPTSTFDVDTTYIVSVINPATGEVEKSTPILASSNNSTVYMSPNSLYLTYTYSADQVSLISDFFTTKASDLISSDLLARIKQLATYNLSSQSKMVELQYLINKYQNGLTDDERLKAENEMTNRMQSYMSVHIRDLQKTGIAKVDLNTMSVTASGIVPGVPLNQFSLDEYQGNLRIATTVSANNFWGYGFAAPAGNSVSDVYVLDSHLSELSSVKDLGKSEQIYSVRFIGAQGYVVTFHQTDPFYVLDLSNPKAATLKGELKIPGYSSYLQPLAENLILGIGKENQNVKLSLFDVKDATAPQEIAKYTLSEYWSEALNNHHAFLQDPKFQTFFLPGSNGGYIFSYAGNTLKLTKAVANISAKRAVFIGNYFYVLADDKIVVISETDGQTVKELDF